MAESRPDMQLDMLTDWDCFQETDLCEQHVLSLLMLLEKKVGDETVITIGMVVDMRADVLPLAA